jgi:hypothetical protein
MRFRPPVRCFCLEQIVSDNRTDRLNQNQSSQWVPVCVGEHTNEGFKSGRSHQGACVCALSDHDDETPQPA